ncbi:MAG: Hpt domain-containing protein [Planctomycetota bacterium]
MDTESRTEKPVAPMLDAASFEDRVGGDEGLMREVLQLFLDGKDKALANVTEAWSRGDAKALRAAAHYFKGEAILISAHALRDVCLEIERKAAAGELPQAGALLEPLKNLVAQTAQAVQGYLGKR